MKNLIPKKFYTFKFATNYLIFNLLFIISGCASIPSESVILSKKINKQLHEIKKSHIASINLNFNNIEQDIIKSIDDSFSHDVVKASISGDSGKLLFTKLDAAKTGGISLEDTNEFLNQYLKSIRSIIEKEKNIRLAPIYKSKIETLENIEDSWSQVNLGNFIILTFLESLLSVRESQDDLLKIFGEKKNSQNIAKEISNLSNNVNNTNANIINNTSKFESLMEFIENGNQIYSNKKFNTR